MMDTSILILCGGKGTRLGQKTKYLPKPLMPVGGTPMLQHIIHQFQEQGFNDFTLGTGYLSEKIEEFIDNYQSPIKIKISNAGENAGMLSRISQGLNSLGNISIVAYGDTFVDIDYKEVVKLHSKANRIVTIITGKKAGSLLKGFMALTKLIGLPNS